MSNALDAKCFRFLSSCNSGLTPRSVMPDLQNEIPCNCLQRVPSRYSKHFVCVCVRACEVAWLAGYKHVVFLYFCCDRPLTLTLTLTTATSLSVIFVCVIKEQNSICRAGSTLWLPCFGTVYSNNRGCDVTRYLLSRSNLGAKKLPTRSQVAESIFLTPLAKKSSPICAM